MSNIEKAAQVIAGQLHGGHRWADLTPLGIAQALADAGLLAPVTRTEWGARWVDGGHVIPQRSKVNAEKWVREVEKSVGSPAEVVTREVTEWTVAP